MKILKTVLMIIASTMMGAVMLFIDDVSVIDTVSGTYVIVINGFLGVDITSMLHKTSKMPKGEYKEMKFGKYALVLVLMLALFGISIYRKEVDAINAVMAMSAFGAGAMLIFGFVMAGLEGNKITTRMGDDK